MELESTTEGCGCILSQLLPPLGYELSTSYKERVQPIPVIEIVALGWMTVGAGTQMPL